MVLLALALIAAPPSGAPAPPHRPTSAIQQASATVRIISGERITADHMPEAAIVTDTKIRAADGSETPARLVEFP